jgi:hypothetical protein
MFTHQIGRGRYGQVARNLTIAVATAALAGGGVALAADGGGSPTTKGGDVASPGTSAKPVQGGVPAGVVTDARARLGGLVADGTITQAEADTVLEGVIAGSVDPDALVAAGKLSAADASPIMTALMEVKRAHAADGANSADGVKQAEMTAAQAERMKQAKMKSAG